MNLAEELARKAEQRRAILQEIKELSRKISKAQEIMQDLNQCKMVISMDVSSWQMQYSLFQSMPITGEVFVTDIFEGNSAERLSIEIPVATNKMNNTASQMEALCSYIQVQITKLTEYIEELQIKIQALREKLSALF